MSMEGGFNNPYIDKLVGIPSENEAEKWHQEVIDIVENFGSKAVEGFEILKTENDIQIISFAANAVDEVMLKYGRTKRIEIPLNNIHILQNGGTEELTGGKLAKGAVSIKNRSIIVDRVKSDVEFARTLFHEMVHLKSYTAMQVLKSDEEPEIEKYRSGIISYNRDYTKKYLETIAEGVTIYLEGVFYNSYLQNASGFKNKGSNSIDLEVNRQKEMGFLNKIVDVLFIKNRDKFSSKEEIFALFVDAQVNGNLLPVARLIENIFGSGSMKEMDFQKIE